MKSHHTFWKFILLKRIRVDSNQSLESLRRIIVLTWSLCRSLSSCLKLITFGLDTMCEHWSSSPKGYEVSRKALRLLCLSFCCNLAGPKKLVGLEHDNWLAIKVHYVACYPLVDQKHFKVHGTRVDFKNPNYLRTKDTYFGTNSSRTLMLGMSFEMHFALYNSKWLKGLCSFEAFNIFLVYLLPFFLFLFFALPPPPPKPPLSTFNFGNALASSIISSAFCLVASSELNSSGSSR